MKIISKLFLVTVFFGINISCNKSRKDELNAVISHYSRETKDSLKLKAARFLIKNLDGQETLDTTSVVCNEPYFNLLNDVWKREKNQYGSRFPIQTKAIDSLNKKLNLPQYNPNALYVNDAQLISADFLIKNIDNAFYVWRNMPWAKTISFEDFCEYILPYRCSDTYSLNARTYFLAKYKYLIDSVKHSDNSFTAGRFIIKDVDSWFAENVNLLLRYPYLEPIKFSNLLKGKLGDCQDANSVRVTALRSLGVPTVMDEIPNWGNSDAPHFWYKIIDLVHDTVKSLITNQNVLRSTQNIITASSYDEPTYKGSPNKVQISYVRTVPKVYRRCFAKQLNSLAMIKSARDEIPTYFNNAWIKDVTDKYLETATATVALNNNVPDQNYAYLCIFDNQHWKPVSWATIKNNKAIFVKMGKNIVYLPAFFYNGKIIPAGIPFLLNQRGEIEQMPPASEKENVVLCAKYPCRSYVLRWENYMVGGRFQFANKSDLSDTITVNTIKNIPFYQTQLNISTPQKYRYLIFQFKGLPVTYISEIAFYGLNAEGKEIKLKGKLIGNPGSYPYTADKLINGNRADLFKSVKNGDSFVGIDLGQNNAGRITKIIYMPYSDDNSVVANDNYELFYWNDEWISLGQKKAGDANSVAFENVPKNALLLVKNTAGGIQERIFTYKNGKQVFW